MVGFILARMLHPRKRAGATCACQPTPRVGVGWQAEPDVSSVRGSPEAWRVAPLLRPYGRKLHEGLGQLSGQPALSGLPTPPPHPFSFGDRPLICYRSPSFSTQPSAHRLSVRTRGFHPRKRGSTPRGRAIRQLLWAKGRNWPTRKGLAGFQMFGQLAWTFCSEAAHSPNSRETWACILVRFPMALVFRLGRLYGPAAQAC